MDVYVTERNFGRYIDVWIFETPTRLLVFNGPSSDDGIHEITSVEVPEGTKPPTPSFTLDHHIVGPLVDALANHRPTKIDETVLDSLYIERKRVDKLIDAVIKGMMSKADALRETDGE